MMHLRIVTPEQLREGYIVPVREPTPWWFIDRFDEGAPLPTEAAFRVERRDYEVVGQRCDGNYTVIDPFRSGRE